MIDALDYLQQNGTDFIAAFVALLTVADVIVRLTPSKKDDNILRVIQSVFDKLFPNRRKGGGKFKAYNDPEDAPDWIEKLKKK